MAATQGKKKLEHIVKEFPSAESVKDPITKLIDTANLSPAQQQELLELMRKRETRPQRRVPPFSMKRMRFGVVGDTHLNSVWCSEKFLHQVYRFFKAEDVEFVIQAGDITEGENMRPWQKYELKRQGHDNVVKYVTAAYPRIEGVVTYFIAGNHDRSYWKTGGADVCHWIAKERPDLIYLNRPQMCHPGWTEGDLSWDGDGKLHPDAILDEGRGVHIKIVHPGDGSAKGRSYKPQELINYLTDKDIRKPNILLMGHYHKSDYLFYQNVHCYEAGTTEETTEFMRERRLGADLQCWLLDAFYKPSGEIDRIDDRVITMEDLK